MALRDSRKIDLARRWLCPRYIQTTAWLTDYGQEKDRKQSLAARLDHYSVKPVDSKELTFILTKITKMRLLQSGNYNTLDPNGSTSAKAGEKRREEASEDCVTACDLPTVRSPSQGFLGIKRVLK